MAEKSATVQDDRGESGGAARAAESGGDGGRSPLAVEGRGARAGPTVDARDILQLLSLGAVQGTELTFTATGPDADEVLDELAELFASRFGLWRAGVGLQAGCLRHNYRWSRAIIFWRFRRPTDKEWPIALWHL